MIIRMTITDNDFTEIIERFASANLFNKLYFGPEKPKEMDCSEWYDTIYIPHRKAQGLLNPNVTTHLEKADKQFLISLIKKEWTRYINTYAKPDDREYLITQFKVSISYRYFEKWENGEVVYYSTLAQKYITQ